MQRNIFPALFLALSLLALSMPTSAALLDILSVQDAATIPSAVYQGDLVTVTFSVQNISGGGQNASDINVSLGLNENDFEHMKTSEYLDFIGSGNSKSVSLRFKARAGIFPGTYKIPVTISYLSGSDRLVHRGEIDLVVSSCKILRVENIALTSETPHVGDTLGISASIANICSTAARNVTIKLLPLTDSTIAPFVVSGGTVKKLGDIQPNSSETVSYSVLLGDRVEAKTYVFAIDANCDECTGTSANQFSFLVLGKPELVFSNIDYSVDNALTGSDKQIMQGSTFTLSIQLDNIGKEKAKAVEVSIDFGKGITGPVKSFLGNIDPDDSGAAVFDLSAAYDAPAGAQQGAITVSYIDELGQKAEFSEPYALYVNEVPPTSPVVYIILLIMVLAVLGAVYFIVRFIFRQLAIRKAQSR